MPASESALLGGLAKEQLGLVIGIGIGSALAAALEPEIVGIRQAQYNSDPNVVVDPATAAAIVAENVELLAWGKDEAKQGGMNSDRFDALVGEVLDAPGFATLLQMLRRGAITLDDFTHGLRKAKLETRWDDGLANLQTERLDPAVIAVSGQRGTMSDAGLLPVGPPSDVGRVPPMPVSPLDPIAEAKASGIDRERLAVMMRNVGLPPGPGELMQLLNRGEIDPADFYRGIAEGNTRNEWAPFLIQLRRRLLTPHEYEEGALRGIISSGEADAGAALSGMEPTDAQFLFNLLGRPLNVHEITTALARGGTYGGDYTDLPEPYQDAIRRSSIRPEYAHLAYANRYTYPSAFVLRALSQAGELGDAQAVAKVLEEIGWQPGFAEKVAASWAPTGKTADPHVTKAQTQLWTTTHSSYIDHRVSDAQATAALETAGVAAGATGDVLAVWQAERELIRAGLTAAQIKKAIGEPGKDAAWATERLRELGWDTADATTFLAE